MTLDGAKRLGAGGPQEIKCHKFFELVNWKKLAARQYTPPFKPNVSSAMDTSNFDEQFTGEAPTDSLSDGSHLSDAVQQQFQGFTFQQTEAIAGSIAGSILTQPIAPPPATRQPGAMRK